MKTEAPDPSTLNDIPATKSDFLGFNFPGEYVLKDSDVPFSEDESFQPKFDEVKEDAEKQPKENETEKENEDVQDKSVEVREIKPLPLLEDKIEAPWSADQYYAGVTQNLISNVLQHNKIEWDGTEKQLGEIAKQWGPFQYQKFQEYVQSEAKRQTDQYVKDKIVPKMQLQNQNRLITAHNRLLEHFPDMPSLVDSMIKLQPQVREKWPELAQNPEAELTLLYHLVKSKTVAQVTKPKGTKMETQGSRRTKSAHERPTQTDDDEVAMVFNRKQDPLSGIFG